VKNGRSLELFLDDYIRMSNVEVDVIIIVFAMYVVRG